MPTLALIAALFVMLPACKTNEASDLSQFENTITDTHAVITGIVQFGPGVAPTYLGARKDGTGKIHPSDGKDPIPFKIIGQTSKSDLPPTQFRVFGSLHMEYATVRLKKDRKGWVAEEIQQSYPAAYVLSSMANGEEKVLSGLVRFDLKEPGQGPSMGYLELKPHKFLPFAMRDNDISNVAVNLKEAPSLEEVHIAKVLLMRNGNQLEALTITEVEPHSKAYRDAINTLDAGKSLSLRGQLWASPVMVMNGNGSGTLTLSTGEQISFIVVGNRPRGDQQTTKINLKRAKSWQGLESGTVVLKKLKEPEGSYQALSITE